MATEIATAPSPPVGVTATGYTGTPSTLEVVGSTNNEPAGPVLVTSKTDEVNNPNATPPVTVAGLVTDLVFRLNPTVG